MARIKFYRAGSLPQSPSNSDDGLWFIKPSGSNPMKIYMIFSGSVVDLDAVDAATLNNLLADKADDNAVVKISGTQTITGKKTFTKVPKINQDAGANNEAVRKGQMDSELSDKADDNAVVKLTGNQTVSGQKKFTTVPRFNQDASNGKDGVRKSQLDTLLQGINTSIDDLETMITDQLEPPHDIDCSSNPNYPTAEKNDRFIVSDDGKIGGANGEDVTEGDLIVCRTDTSGGDSATAADDFYILQTNIHDATTTVKGYIKLATQSEVNSGSNNKKAVTPNTLSVRLTALENSIENTLMSEANNKYVRYDATQGLSSSEKNKARGNIGAASDSEVVKKAGAQTITGTKTFSNSPKVPAASSNDEAVRKGQMDTALADKADDDSVVKLTGNQSVNGRKTFSTAPRSTSDASSGNDLVRKSQMDSELDDVTLKWTTDNWN